MNHDGRINPYTQQGDIPTALEGELLERALKAEAEVAQLNTTIEKVLEYADESQIPTEYDDDWIHADDVRTIIKQGSH